MRARLLVPLALALAAAGCGGGGEGERSPVERLQAALPAYERALAEQDCEAFARFVHSTVRPARRGTDDPPDARECRNLGLSYTRLEGFEAARSKVFGSAALVEGDIGGQLVVLVWTLDLDGSWKQVQASPPGVQPQLRGHRQTRDRYDANAAAWVRAMRAGDCRRVFRLLNPASPLVGPRDDEGEFCSRFRAARADPARLPAQLAQAPAAKPIDLGGTPDFHFYALDTGRGRRWTVILSTLPPGLPAGVHVQDSVLDYYPSSL